MTDKLAASRQTLNEIYQVAFFNGLARRGIPVSNEKEAADLMEIAQRLESYSNARRSLEKRAYGVEEPDQRYDRYMDGGHVHGKRISAVIKDIQKMQREAELNNVQLAYSPYRYHVHPETDEAYEYDSAAAIQRLQALADKSRQAGKGEKPDFLGEEDLPMYFAFKSIPDEQGNRPPVNWKDWKTEAARRPGVNRSAKLLQRNLFPIVPNSPFSLPLLKSAAIGGKLLSYAAPAVKKTFSNYLAPAANKTFNTAKQTFNHAGTAANKALNHAGTAANKALNHAGTVANKALNTAKQTFNYAAPTAKKFTSEFVKPTRKPNPNYAANAAPMPTNTSANMATRALNYVSNVPKGERFAQRPIANTLGMISMDGVPGMRRVGQGAVLSTGLYAVNQARNFNNSVNAGIEMATPAISRALDLPSSSNPEINRQLYGLKWDLARDSTVGAFGRYLRPEDNKRQELHDKIVRDNLWDAAGYAVRMPAAKSEPSVLEPAYSFLRNRNASAFLSNQLASATDLVVPPPRHPLTALKDTRESFLQSQQAGQETSYEKLVRSRFPQVDWDNITPEKKSQILALLMAGVGGAGAYGAMQ